MRHIDMSGDKSITLKVRGGYHTISLNDIMYLDYRNHVVTYHLFSGEEISTTTLRIGFFAYLSENLSDTLIIPCHESVAVSIPAIDELKKNEITVRNKEIIPVSKSRYSAVAERYMSYRFDD